MKGLTINFEGVDGAGKSYALEHLKKYYESQGREVVIASSISPSTFRKAFDSRWYDLSNKSNLYAQYLSYEINNYYKNIKPNVEQGKIVLIDRFIPSCFAYNELPKDDFQSFLVNFMGILCEKFFVPDVTFIFDVEDNVLVDRFQRFKHEVDDKLDLDFTHQVRKGYENFKMLFGKFMHRDVQIGRWNIVNINGAQPIDKIVDEMVQSISEVQNVNPISL